ncbi:hypothetical protein TSH100_17170 [Azospirillum sp. TSH100]|uniref:helix-turn-helix domain-containing protein n=1 Tax=Azospirillum sp. TSH100 TaxID=652764 RepID=UPI000D607E90|nr:XRE family transcriptional regulator [Azospirillum sp. TSH100]PWC84738.1 hypothetical protein TSH100_17170 [Azospirillum sp. TSH100]QCG90148.1 helix-turn-helix domain-containing protein [Azospirillum sp. TSH100]
MLASTMKRLRTAARLTLQQLSERSGVSVSTLSKIENGQLSPTYEKIAALASGLGVEVGELFGQVPKPTPLGRRSITKAGSGVVYETDQYRYEAVNADLPNKRFVPLVATIKARSTQEFNELPRHDGEEFIYVLEGEVTVHTDFYTPFTLSRGDSCYFDSTMGHACVSAGDDDARVLWVSSHTSFA